MSSVDLAQIEVIIAEVAATEIMPRFCKLAAGDVEMKGVNDPVTVADKEAERALIARLTQALPGSVVVGEESFAADPRILSHFSGERDVWVIDPIDGTRNFVDGKTEFATMVALVRGRQAVAGWIHDPNSGDTLMAEQGGGVWLNGGKMRLAGQDAAVERTAIIGSRLKTLLARAERISMLDGLPRIETGSAAAFDYGRLFAGDQIFAGSPAARVAFLLYRQSKPWDHVPGLFMVQEAQGYAADLTGQPYDMRDGLKGLLVGPDAASWQAFNRALQPVVEGII